MKIIIFDVDGTIIEGDSQIHFLKFLYKNNYIGAIKLFLIIGWYILYKLKIVNNLKEILLYSYKISKGKSQNEIDRLIDLFFESDLKKFIYKDIVNLINEYKKNGHKIILLSASTDIIIKKIAEFLKINDYGCTRLEKINNIYTGKIAGEIVIGEEKLKWLNNFILENNLNGLYKIAYTDSLSDEPIMRMADKSLVVNPSEKLKKIAKIKNWEVLYLK